MDIIQKAKIILRDRVLMKHLGFLLLGLAFFRLLGVIPVPGIDPTQLQNFLGSNQFFGLLNIFAGGGLSQLSIIMLGVGAYITAAIIMQLLTVMIPKLKNLYHHEGQMGRKKFSQYSRLLTIPIAAIQGFGLLFILSRQGILNAFSTTDLIVNVIIVIAGAVLIMWIGELMTEFGIGNGISLLIFAGIVAIIPQQVQQLFFTFDMSQLLTYIGFIVAAVLIVAGVALVSEAERLIPITYAKQARGGSTYGGASTYLPLRINQAGVMPLIFALSILLFPQMVANFLVNSSHVGLQSVAELILRFLNNGLLYSVTYFVLVFVFTYFYTAITFDPEAVAENLHKNGAFIPGIRPGQSTTDYIAKIVNRITLIGALFLGLIAVVPIVMQSITGVQSFAVGGTALLIVVAVVLDLMKKIDAQISMHQY